MTCLFEDCNGNTWLNCVLSWVPLWSVWLHLAKQRVASFILMVEHSDISLYSKICVLFCLLNRPKIETKYPALLSRRSSFPCSVYIHSMSQPLSVGSLHKVSFSGNLYFPSSLLLVSRWFPSWQPQVSSGFHVVSCLATPGFQWFPRGFLLETPGFQWFPRGFHSGIWAVSAFHGMETTGKLGVAGMETRWKPRVNPGFPASFL